MPFDVVNGSVTFQEYINSVLREYLDSLCIVNLDNIVIYSIDPAQYTNDVRAVLKRLLKYGLFVKLEKYIFRVKERSFWGFCLQLRELKWSLVECLLLQNSTSPQLSEKFKYSSGLPISTNASL